MGVIVLDTVLPILDEKGIGKKKDPLKAGHNFSSGAATQN